MTDLIDRKAAIDFKVSHGIDDDGVLYVPYGEVKKYLEQLPSVQLEIIRCKDCKHNANPPEAANADCDLFYGMTEQYGFCHRAERRADE